MGNFLISLNDLISISQPNDNTTQPQHFSWVGHENDFTNPTTQTQHQAVGAPDKHLLTTT